MQSSMKVEIKVRRPPAQRHGRSWCAILLLLGGIAGIYVLGDQPIWVRWLLGGRGRFGARGLRVLTTSQYGR